MPRGRFEEEVEEILRRARLPSRPRVRRRWQWPRIPLPSTSSTLLAMGGALLLVALFAPGPLRGWGIWLFWGGLLLLVAFYASYWARRQPRVEKRWRGRPIETRSGWWKRLRSPFRR
jgi:hypothetical protein